MEYGVQVYALFPPALVSDSWKLWGKHGLLKQRNALIVYRLCMAGGVRSNCVMEAEVHVSGEGDMLKDPQQHHYFLLRCVSLSSEASGHLCCYRPSQQRARRSSWRGGHWWSLVFGRWLVTQWKQNRDYLLFLVNVRVFLNGCVWSNRDSRRVPILYSKWQMLYCKC